MSRLLFPPQQQFFQAFHSPPYPERGAIFGRWILTSAEIQARIEHLRRVRFPFMLIRSFSWFKNLTDEKRYDVEERIGMCVGSGPMTLDAYVLAEDLK